MTAANTIYALAFYAIAAVCVASALVVVFHKNPVISALYLVVCFFGLASAYVMLQAHFLAAVQVLLYAGAVLVLFLMIIMLLDLRPRDLGKPKPSVGKVTGGAAAFGVVMLTAAVMLGVTVGMVPDRTRPAADRPDEVAQLLVQLGEDPQIITGKFTPRLSTYEGRSVAIASGSVLASLLQDETLGLAQDFRLPDPKTGALTYRFPKIFADMPKDKFEQVCLNLGRDLRSEATVDLETYTVRNEYPEIEKQDVIDLIKVGAYARLKYLTEFGTTAAVGRQLFWRHYLPFEASGLLLLAAILGVMVLTRRASGEGGRS